MKKYLIILGLILIFNDSFFAKDTSMEDFIEKHSRSKVFTYYCEGAREVDPSCKVEKELCKSDKFVLDSDNNKHYYKDLEFCKEQNKQ